MEKDIEKLLDNMVVPEMEYVKTKNAVAVPEVPEVVLPKTKAEMYREAKGRLDQKTVPASVAYEPKKSAPQKSERRSASRIPIGTQATIRPNRKRSKCSKSASGVCVK